MHPLDGPVSGWVDHPASGRRDSMLLWFDGRDLLSGTPDDGVVAGDPQALADRYAIDDLSLESLPDAGQPLRLLHSASGRLIEVPAGSFAMTVRAAARHLRTPAADMRGYRTLFLFMLPVIVLYLLPILGILALVAAALWYGTRLG